MIVISNSLALAETDDNPLDTPVFGWKSIVTTGNVEATSAAAGFPVTNLANASTNLRWASDPGSPAEDQYLTITVSQVDEIDYLAVAVHNFGSESIPVSVEGTDGTGSPEDWTELVAPRMLANDDPVIFRFTPQSLAGLRLRMQTGDADPYAAVLYAGKLLVSPYGTFQDHIPINLAKTVDAPIGVSESGHFLGRVVVSEQRASPISLRHLKSSWYRTNMDPFVKASRTSPFFFAWMPKSFPNDVGFCYVTNDPQPTRSFDTGRFSIDFEMQGVAV